MTINLDTLRKTAEKANSVLPEPWIVMGDSNTVSVVELSNRDGSIISGGAVADAHTTPFRDHIATFDPPTVLALMSRLEQAEQAVARVRDVIKGAPTVDPLRGFAGPPDDWPDDTHFTSYGEWIMANRVREALNGDGRG